MEDSDTVLGKALAILRAFGPADSVLPLAELVRRTGLAKGTVHRVAGDLVHHRLLDKTDHGYRLSGGPLRARSARRHRTHPAGAGYAVSAGSVRTHPRDGASRRARGP
ncbi:helix-turn-helix domain-containing protein [Streptomyces sp. NBC_01602]|uniref:helix-turn-helix domain-containing protein n=1 Tax=Streptomyces sp. NBC_01602 TaxID=2975893 RepID=UPI00386A6141